MKKILCLFLIVLFISTFTAAQEETLTRKGMKSVYLELGGNGLFLTLNFERFLTHKLNYRVGGLIVPSSSGITIFAAVMGNMVWSEGNYSLETGLGLMIIGGEYIDMATDETSSGTLGFTGTVGLRYQPKRGGILFRLGFTPIIFPGGVIPWVGFSIGYSFR